jgi:hypothetical protein
LDRSAVIPGQFTRVQVRRLHDGLANQERDQIQVALYVVKGARIAAPLRNQRRLDQRFDVHRDLAAFQQILKRDPTQRHLKPTGRDIRLALC